ncbi:MAG: 16S rRNA (cytosine(967)-C(5))-methyltransferase RsmB [Clostridia bacterium]|nr:16S rRNA (cytosine(967)-C(5))-methyltransferase RsmB [Clostridia bacterium]
MRDTDNGQKKFEGGKKFENRRPQGEKKFGDKRSHGEFKGEKKFGERKPYGEKKFDGERRPYGEKKFDGDRKPYGEKKFDGERKPYGEKKFDGERKPYGEKKFDGERKPYGEKKFDGDRKPYGEKKFDGERKPRGEFKGERKFDDRKPHSDRPFGERRERRTEKPVPQKNARDVALAALADVVRNEAYASQALDRALTDVELSNEDRRLAASLFYFTVENRLQIEWALNGLMDTKPEPLVNDILHIAAAQILFMSKIPDHAAVDEAVKMVRYMGRPGLDKLVNGVLRSLIRARDEGGLEMPDPEENPVEYLSVRCSLAKPAVERLVNAYGVELAEQIASYIPEERTMTVRPNTTKMTAAEFESLLDAGGFHWKRGAVENSYILSGAGSIAGHQGYRDGLFSIQGESSMLAAQAVQAKRGMQILDACSAPGGKTCLMAEAMGGSGRVHAWDVHPHRVELVRAAAHRLGLENVRPAVHDARKPIESMELMMDAVLVDAPCSGLGVMGDKPDIKFRTKEEDLVNILPLQREILESCAKAVKVGGRLVYSTCTILPEENEMQVRAFLERHPEFEIDTDASWLPESLRGRMEDGMLQLLPARDGVEGFFIARMIRRSL